MKNKKLIVIISIVVIVLLGIISFLVFNKPKKENKLTGTAKKETFYHKYKINYEESKKYKLIKKYTLDEYKQYRNKKEDKKIEVDISSFNDLTPESAYIGMENHYKKIKSKPKDYSKIHYTGLQKKKIHGRTYEYVQIEYIYNILNKKYCYVNYITKLEDDAYWKVDYYGHELPTKEDLKFLNVEYKGTNIE